MKCLENGGIAFTNIGMLYSEKQLGAIGIGSELTILAAIQPYRTGRRLSTIISIIDEKGNELLAVEQWMKGVMVTVYDTSGIRLGKLGIGEVLSRDSVTNIAVSVHRSEMHLFASGLHCSSRSRPIQLPYNFFGSGRLIAGLSPAGRSPWRGELTGSALYTGAIVEDTIRKYLTISNNQERFTLPALEKPAALFRFECDEETTIPDISRNRWNLNKPRFPKFFKHQFIEVLPKNMRLSRSLLNDITVNFFGFIPFGAVFFLLASTLLRSRKKALLVAIILALVVSFSIELIQIFIPTRASQLMDVLLNVGGTIVGASAGFAVKNYLQTKSTYMN